MGGGWLSRMRDEKLSRMVWGAEVAMIVEGWSSSELGTMGDLKREAAKERFIHADKDGHLFFLSKTFQAI